MRSTSSLIVLAIACGAAIAAGASPVSRPSAVRAASRPASQPSAAAAAAGRQNPRVTCAANVSKLLAGAQLAANVSPGGLFPNDLAAIFGEIDDDLTLDPAIVTCPSGHHAQAPKDWATMAHADRVAWAVAHTSYVWSGGGIDPLKAITSHVDDVLIVLTESPADHPTHGGGMNVGFADGHVAFVATADLPGAIARSDAARAKLK